jgi:hypothetical protein
MRSPIRPSAPGIRRGGGSAAPAYLCGLLGSCHNSLSVYPFGDDVNTSYSWNAARTRRDMYGRRMSSRRTDPHRRSHRRASTHGEVPAYLLTRLPC